MKLIGLRKTGWGFTLAEYLIILGIAAIAAIAIIGVFGAQIKQAFSSSTAAMAGVSTSNTDHESSAKISQDNMGTFTAKAGGGSGGGSSGSGSSGGGGSTESGVGSSPAPAPPTPTPGRWEYDMDYSGPAWYIIEPSTPGLPPLMRAVPFGTPGASYYDHVPPEVFVPDPEIP